MTILTMSNVDLAGKRVLIREDLNVPLKDGEVVDDTRIRACKATVEHALGAGARVILVSHLGRPKQEVYDEALTLAPVARALSRHLGTEILLVRDWRQHGLEMPQPGRAVMLENIRFEPGEKADDPALAQALAALCDVYVMDAFGTAHRAHASTHGVIQYAPVACAGPLLMAEVDALRAGLSHPARPLLAVLGGSKVSTKVTVMEALLERVDQLIVGGGIANAFIAASGYSVGGTPCEARSVEEAQRLLALADARGAAIPIPEDVVCARDVSPQAEGVVKPVGELADGELILDVGPATARRYAELVRQAGTVIWNGPLGVFEIDQFGEGTRVLAEAVAASSAYSMAGGGDTLAAIAKYGVGDRISYMSTGGGAFLEFVEGRTLPAVAALEARAAEG